MKKTTRTPAAPPPSKPSNRLFVLGALATGILIGISCCWIYLSQQSSSSSTAIASNESIRINGYQFTKPILIGDHGSGADSPEFIDTRNQIQQIVDTAIHNNKVSSTSVYFRNLNISQQFSVNGGETYFPASLTKVPLMISYLKQAEITPGLLEETVRLSDQSFNERLEVEPDESPTPGQEYSNNQLIEYMIKYSDNNSFTQLISNQKNDQLRKLYDDMQVYYPFDQKILSDVITPGQFSLFFRILYNSTYLTSDDSEKALSLLNQSQFKDGIVAGVKDGTPVAHKFGISTNYNSDGSMLMNRQLHDCGIIYHPKSPYVLCVMTKGKSNLHDAEQVIQDISHKVYQAVEDRSK